MAHGGKRAGAGRPYGSKALGAKSDKLSTRLYPDVREALNRVADEVGVSVSHAAGDLLKFAIQEYDADPSKFHAFIVSEFAARIGEVA